MNRMLKSILTLTAFGATALGLLAQPVLKTVDMSKLLEGYYRTEQEMAKLKTSEQKASEELERMVKEGNQVADQYKAMAEQSKNTLLTPDARSKAEADAAKMLEDIQHRQTDINNFRTNTQRLLSQQWNNIRGVLVEEIMKKVGEEGKKQGATIVLDRNAVVYAETGDITDACMAAINKDRPVTPPPAAAAVPAAAAPTASPAGAETPSVTVPGLKK